MKADLVVNQKQLAAVLGLTTRQVRNLDEQGLPSAVDDGKNRNYDLSQAVPWYIRYIRETMRSSEKEQAEIRERKAKAALAELDLQERAGALVPLEIVEDVLGPVLDDVRARVLNLPGRVAGQFPDSRAAMEILKPATNECIAAIQDMAKTLERQGGDPLPEDFPALKVLQGAGIGTVQELRALESLRSIRGIGPKMELRIADELRRMAA